MTRFMWFALITNFVCVSCSPLTTDFPLPWRSNCHEDSTCTGPRFLHDPLTNYQIVDPEDGAVRIVPIEVRFAVDVTSTKEYEEYYADAHFCVELNGQWKDCKTPGGPPIIFQSLPDGNYTAAAYITDKVGQARYHETQEIAFTVLNQVEYNLHNAQLAERSREEQHFPVDIELLRWAELEEQMKINKEGDGDIVLPRSHVSSTTSPMLLIGVKTAVVTRFPRRQAIRDTWANPATLPHDVKVLFLGCEPNVTVFQNERDRRRVLLAVAKERAVYKDLLTEELECTDSYRGLSDKVKSFMHLSAAEFPDAAFVMIADDDIYVNVDQLADHLRKANRSDLYFGEVWSVKFGKQEPIRYPESQYYLPEDQYPMRNLLPYATGPHYVVSMRNVRFIAKNYWRLSSMNGLEDVSSGIWLQTMQVNAQHTSEFSSFRASMKCEDNLVSFADLSPLGIRSIHSNLVNNRSFCHGFHSVTWHRHFNVIPSLAEMLQRPTQEAEQPNPLQLDIDENVVKLWDIEVFVNDLNISKYLEVTSIVSTPSKAGIKVKYFPSAETLFSYSQRMCAQVQTLMKGTEFNSMVCDSVALELRTQLQQKLLSIERAESINRASLELWRYNLFVADPEASPIIIAHADQAVYVSTLLECLFVSVYEHHKRPILVLPAWTVRKHYGNKPDVFVFSNLDADCESVIKTTCQQAVANYIDEYSSSNGTNQENHSTTIIMIAGEPADTQGLDERVLLLSTVSSLNQKKHAYLPVASTSFGERLRHPPSALLMPVTPYEPERRRFCAYLYARCDRPQREYMFDILNAMEPVDALGICAGSSRLPEESYAVSRYSTWYNDDAVATFQNYKFVIAFENSGVPGYVTEKLVNPFLAGSIPIYLGNSTTVTEIFNPNSFIDCGRFEKLRDCASYVMKVHKCPELYAQMRREPPIENITAFNEAFSWHPSIPSRALADKVAKLIHSNQT